MSQLKMLISHEDGAVHRWGTPDPVKMLKIASKCNSKKDLINNESMIIYHPKFQGALLIIFDPHI